MISHNIHSVYVAAASAEVSRARHAMRELEIHGYEVTSNWPDVIESVGVANPPGATAFDRRHWSWTCLQQLERASVLWLLMPEAPTVGAFVELGYAIARAKRIVTSGDTRRSIFTSTGQEFATDGDALAFLLSRKEEIETARQMGAR